MTTRKPSELINEARAAVVEAREAEHIRVRAKWQEDYALLDYVCRKAIALEVQVAALTEDAERYQWLRLHGYVDSMKKIPRSDPVEIAMFDLAIDIAIKESK